MSDRTHKILTYVLGAVFAGCTTALAMPQVNSHPTAVTALTISLAVLGSFGIGIARPMFGSKPATVLTSVPKDE